MYLATVPGLLHEESSRVRDWGDNMRTDSVIRGDRYGGPQVPAHDRRRRYSTRFHSGRGCQYTSEQLARHLESYGTRPSVGRTGVCWDNAWAESFNATLKNERVHRMAYPTRRKAINDIASWIELIYNQTRLHSALGYRTPNEAEHDLVSSNKAA